MKFIPIIENVVDENQLKAEYKHSQSVNHIKLGETVLFCKKGLKKYYIPIANIYRAFRRVKCIPVRINKGTGKIQLENIVLCSNKAELMEVDLPNEESVNIVLNYLQEKNSKIKIGVKK